MVGQSAQTSYFLWRKEAAQAILLFQNTFCFLKVLERHFKLSQSSYVHHKHYQYCNLMKFVELKSLASSPRATGHTFHQNRKYCMGCFQVSSWILPCIICEFLSHRNVYKQVTKKSYSNMLFCVTNLFSWMIDLFLTWPKTWWRRSDEKESCVRRSKGEVVWNFFFHQAKWYVNESVEPERSGTLSIF